MNNNSDNLPFVSRVPRGCALFPRWNSSDDIQSIELPDIASSEKILTLLQDVGRAYSRECASYTLPESKKLPTERERFSCPVNRFEGSKSTRRSGGRQDDAGIRVITGRGNVKHSLPGNIWHPDHNDASHRGMLFIILVAAAGRRGSRDLIHEARSRNSFRSERPPLAVRIRREASGKIKKKDQKERERRPDVILLLHCRATIPGAAVFSPFYTSVSTTINEPRYRFLEWLESSFSYPPANMDEPATNLFPSVRTLNLWPCV